MWNKNDKVPMAILSCFLIAFVLQGILKLSGVFVFEKALGWEIFGLIDNNLWLQIIYYSILNLIASYCLSFSLSSKPFSKKWYHYIIIVVSSFLITTIRMLFKTPMFMEFVYDTLLYIIVPVIITLTNREQNRLFINKSIVNIVTLITIHIALYFCYLGLCYWSTMLNSILLISQISVYTSTHFLIFFEMYIGLALIMLSMNSLINNLNKGDRKL